MMKKILHISKYYYPFSGGTEQIARDCVNALKDEYEQKVIAFNDGKEDVNDYVDAPEINADNVDDYIQIYIDNGELTEDDVKAAEE